MSNTWHIVGADGFIGTQLINYLSNKNINLKKYTSNKIEDMHYLNLCNNNTLFYNSLNEGDYIILLAAISSPDICHNQYKFAYDINVTHTSEFVSNCLLKNCKVLFFSSDTVFGKSNQINDENSETVPFGEYAEMKAIVEKKFMNHPNFKVFRLSYVFSKYDKFTNYLLKCKNEKNVAEVFEGLYRNVVYLNDILEGIYKLFFSYKKFSNTFFHMCGNQLLSRKDLAEIIKNKYKDLEYKIIKEPNNFYDARAYKIRLNTIYTEKLLGRKMTSINDVIKNDLI